MSPAEQLPETQHRHRERDRLIALGRRSDSRERCTLLVINEADGSWSFHGLGAAVGVVRRVHITLDATIMTATILTQEEAVKVGEAILSAATSSLLC